MRIKLYQIDAFTDVCFKGNPAAVCPLDTWLPDELLQKIAMENNLSETAFFVGDTGRYTLRWFTPVNEVKLCGHATLATAWVLANEHGESISPVRFDTRSGELRVVGSGDRFTLDFPQQKAEVCRPPEELLAAIDVEPVEVLAAEDYLVILKNETEVKELSPDMRKLMQLELRGVIFTAPGNHVDFVSRWFGPKVGVDEDPVTGSAHATLTPYWAEKLNRSELEAHQVSERGGKLSCRIDSDRVYITGTAVKYLEGEIYL